MNIIIWLLVFLSVALSIINTLNAVIAYADLKYQQNLYAYFNDYSDELIRLMKDTASR